MAAYFSPTFGTHGEFNFHENYPDINRLSCSLYPHRIQRAGEKPSRPNILFAFVDDWGRQASAYAKLDGAERINNAVSTPNFDRLATEGVLFCNAFVNAPSCTPCRSSLLSALYFWRTGRGAILRGEVWDTKIST